MKKIIIMAIISVIVAGWIISMPVEHKTCSQQTVTDSAEPEKNVVRFNLNPGTYKNTIQCANGQSMQYFVRIPENCTSDMPMVIWMHGVGECGNPSAVSSMGPICAANNLNEERFIILQPCTSFDWSTDYVMDMTCEVIDYVADQLMVDTDRLILTGHSLGSYGCWYYGAHRVGKWAALSPVSGATAHDLSALIDDTTPIWAFYGGNEDYGVKAPVDEVIRKCVQAERPNVELSATPGMGHGQMSLAPYDANWFDWAEMQSL